MDKIVFVIPNLGGGGAERVLSELANFFISSAYNVTIILTRSNEIVYEVDKRINIIDISLANKGMFSRIKALRHVFKTNNFNCIISFLVTTNIETILSTFFLKKKVIISERNDPFKEPKNKIIRFIRRIIYPYANGYVFQTEDAMKYFSKKIQKKSTVIYNPIKSNLPLCSHNRSLKIVGVGRLVEQKNFKLFIDAFENFSKTYKNYKAEIYGDGPLKDSLQEYIDGKGLKESILLKGFSTDLVHQIYDASMFIMTSNYEGMSNALIEALGMGIPTISTDHPIGGARAIINNGTNGYLVPVGDFEQLSETMKLIASNPNISNRISNNALKIRFSLSIDEISKKWINYIDTIK